MVSKFQVSKYKKSVLVVKMLKLPGYGKSMIQIIYNNLKEHVNKDWKEIYPNVHSNSPGRGDDECTLFFYVL